MAIISGKQEDGSIDSLRERWTYLYKEYLPALAEARDPSQPRWPVYLDHCFARIILDNAVGIDQPWMETVKQPAVKHMSIRQMTDAIVLAEKITTGDADLVSLNERSLELRGEEKRKVTSDTQDVPTPRKKQKKEQDSAATISTYFLPSPGLPPHIKDEQTPGQPNKDQPTDDGKMVAAKSNPDMEIQLKRISDSNITSFRKQTLTLLCQVPKGRYSTYQAMSDHITKASHKTCARAVGNAMRNNPFAPEVPCHRILAADGTLGGFNGSWGEKGKYAGEKHKILHEEGVRFDSRGRVKGPPFREFT